MIRAPAPSPLQRAAGRVEIGFAARDGVTRLAHLYQAGCGKARLPRSYDGHGPVAVLLNTSGGVTGGDRLSYRVDFAAGSQGAVTTQAAEKVYRRSVGHGEIASTLTVGDGARAAWIPQETIVFNGSALKRTLDVALAPGAELVALEILVLGRSAHGETVRDVALRDRWRIRRGPALIYADTLRLDGDAADILAGTATGNGAHVLATLVHVAPDAASRLDGLRALTLDGGVTAGFSAVDGMITARLLGVDALNLRKTVCRIVEHLRGTAMPRVWTL